MSNSRQEMPPGDARRASETSTKRGELTLSPLPHPTALATRIRRAKRRMLGAIGRDDPDVRVPVRQTAELRMIRAHDGLGMEPQVFDCGTCSERDGVATKLLMMKLQTRPASAGAPGSPVARTNPSRCSCGSIATSSNTFGRSLFARGLVHPREVWAGPIGSRDRD